MGGGGQPKNTTTTTETKIPDWLASDYQGLISQTNAQNAKPYQSYQGQLNAPTNYWQDYASNIATAGANGNAQQ